MMGFFFQLSNASSPALGPIQSPIQLVPEFLFPGGKAGGDVKVTTHLHLVPKLKCLELHLHSPYVLLYGA
jgi:hypothetical protein